MVCHPKFHIKALDIPEITRLIGQHIEFGEIIQNLKNLQLNVMQNGCTACSKSSCTTSVGMKTTSANSSPVSQKGSPSVYLVQLLPIHHATSSPLQGKPWMACHVLHQQQANE